VESSHQLHYIKTLSSYKYINQGGLRPQLNMEARNKKLKDRINLKPFKTYRNLKQRNQIMFIRTILSGTVLLTSFSIMAADWPVWRGAKGDGTTTEAVSTIGDARCGN
jgi:hypothetical protein